VYQRNAGTVSSVLSGKTGRIYLHMGLTRRTLDVIGAAEPIAIDLGVVFPLFGQIFLRVDSSDRANWDARRSKWGWPHPLCFGFLPPTPTEAAPSRFWKGWKTTTLNLLDFDLLNYFPRFCKSMGQS